MSGGIGIWSKSIGIPTFIIAAAGYQLAQHPTLCTALFESTTAELMSIFAIFVALIVAAVSTSHVVVASSSSSSSSTNSYNNNNNIKKYPLDAIDQAPTDTAKFMAVYPMLKRELLEHMKHNNEMPHEALDWCDAMLDYNVPGGKLNRGTTVVAACRALLGRELSATQVARASVLGWAVEFLQAFFLVADDVMDESVTRRGQPCWYKRSSVKWIAINDSFLLESFVFTILKEHFGQEPYYSDLLELMLDVIQKTEFGQLLDLTSQPHDGAQMDLTRFTEERYRNIVKYKTAFYSFYLPVALAMILSEIKDKEAFVLARKICCTMGEYFQVQDDYLDCFGDPSVIGKVGTDIQDNKCSWLVVQALKRATPHQQEILKENYGQWDDAKVKKIKDLYKEMGIEKAFEDYEEESYKVIQSDLAKVKLMPKEVFEILLQKIYKRSK
jgi:farnesyl diphosphate synthase